MKPVFTTKDFAVKAPRPSLWKKLSRLQFPKKTPKGPKPPKQKKPGGPKRPWLRWAMMTLGGLFLLAVITVVGVFLYFSKDLPGPDTINQRVVAESTKIYDRTGTVVLYDIHGEEKRTVIPFAEMPDVVKNATIALEDDAFYDHIGFDVGGIFKAVLNKFFGIGSPRGGSTITQQFIKNSVLTSERTITRKIKELILSLQLERKFEKDEILAMYLNEIPYGSNAYGIEAAAQTFFNKHAKDLALDEAAVLASLPKAPTLYSPYGSNRERLKSRKDFALQRMADLGYITPGEAEAAQNTDTFAKLAPNREDIKAPHMVIYVREYLQEKYGDEALEKGGLKVITTLDWELHQIAEKAVSEGAKNNQEKWNAENAALVAVDPKTGEVLTMVGSRNFFDEQIDGQVNVATSERQPGSSFKPYVYLTAFEKGYTPETLLYDVETEFPSGTDEPYIPQNYDGKFRGPVQIKDSLGQSLNTTAVKTLYLVGIENAISTAHRLGITSLNRPNPRQYYGLSLVLGGGEVRLLDHVAAFAVLANNGVKHEKTTILRVEDKDGEVLEEIDRTDAGERVVAEEHLTQLNHVLSTNDYRVPGFAEQNPLRFDERNVAAKTGTTNEFRDGWTMGYTPNLAVGVWAGNNDNRPMREGAAGSVVAAPIWRSFLVEALKRYEKESFTEYKKEDFETEKDVIDGERPEDEGEEIKVCEIPGEDDNYCLANKHCPDDEEKKRTFISAHSILHYVNREDPLGDEPENPKNDILYKDWEKAITKFYEKQDDKKVIFDSPPEKECKADDFKKFKPEIKISVPGSVSENKVKIKADVDAPYDIKSVEFYVDGDKVGSDDDDNASYTYDIPDSKNGDTITVKVKVTDKNGNTAEDDDKVSVSF